MLEHYPASRLVTSEDFALWLSQLKYEEPVDQLHYEFSIIAALGSDEYLGLGQRQSYFAGSEKRQRELIALLNQWEDHLKEQGGVDPMITKLPRSANPRYLAVYCDETQNLPPVALLYLMAQAQQQQFIACLDSEQCLLSSPFILSVIKKMMYLTYQQQDREFLLPRTWRCPSAVAKVANHLIDTKHRLHKESDEALRRPYREIVSARNLAENGLVSLFHQKNAARLRELASSPKSVIIVEELTPTIREAINRCLNSNNILSAKEAIGLDFKNVILWHPIQETSLKTLAKGKKVQGLSLAQMNTFNALYVGISRSEANVFIVEDYDRFQVLIQTLFGDGLAKNQIPIAIEHLSPEQQRQEWFKQVEFHLSQGRLDIAHSIMGFHLKMNKTQIDDFCKARLRSLEPEIRSHSLAVAAPIAQIPVERKTQATPTKPVSESQTSIPVELATTAASLEIAKKSSLTDPEERRRKGAIYVSGLLRNLYKSTIALKDQASLDEIAEQNRHHLANSLSLTYLMRHPQAIRLLFEPLLEDGTCLFAHLISPTLSGENSKLPIRRDVLLDEKVLAFLCKQGDFLFAKKNKDPKTPTVFHLLCKTKVGQELLVTIFTRSPVFEKMLTPEHLYSPIDGVSAFFNLACTNSDSRKLLAAWLERRQDLISAIKEEDLFKAPLNTPEVFASMPLFFNLTITMTGLQILKLIYNHNPRVLNNLTGALLSEEYNGIEPNLNNTSAFLWLTSAEGFPFFEKLIAMKPSLIAELPLKNLLLKSSPSELKPSLKTVIRNHFSQPPHSLVYVKRLFEAHPAIIEGLSAELIITSFQTPNGGSTSIIRQCSLSEEGMALLTHLLVLNPKLARGLMGHNLCEKDTNLSTTIYNLSKTSNGIKLLRHIKYINPLMVITLRLTDINTSHGKNEPSMALLNLLSTAEGIDFFIDCCTNPISDFVKHFDFNNLKKCLNDAAGAFFKSKKQLPDNYPKLIDTLRIHNRPIAVLIEKFMCKHMNIQTIKASSPQFFAPEPTEIKGEAEEVNQGKTSKGP